MSPSKCWECLCVFFSFYQRKKVMSLHLAVLCAEMKVALADIQFLLSIFPHMNVTRTRSENTKCACSCAFYEYYTFISGI